MLGTLLLSLVYRLLPGRPLLVVIFLFFWIGLQLLLLRLCLFLCRPAVVGRSVALPVSCPGLASAVSSPVVSSPSWDLGFFICSFQSLAHGSLRLLVRPRVHLLLVVLFLPQRVLQWTGSRMVLESLLSLGLLWLLLGFASCVMLKVLPLLLAVVRVPRFWRIPELGFFPLFLLEFSPPAIPLLRLSLTSCQAWTHAPALGPVRHSDLLSPTVRTSYPIPSEDWAFLGAV